MPKRVLSCLGVVAAYYALSAAGFATLNYLGIDYLDERIIWAGIPMMVILAGLALWAQRDRAEIFNLRQLWFRWDWTPLFLIPFLTLASIIGVFVESGVRGTFSMVLVYAVVLSLLIGLAEELTFRRLILELPGRNPGLLDGFLVFAFSVLSFGFVHLMNVFSNMSLAEAFNQSLYTMSFGVVAALVYLATRNIMALVFWHMLTDFSLFVNQVDVFYTPAYLGQAIDWIMWISTGLSVIYLGLRFYRRYLRAEDVATSTATV